jgi:SAM-dependent methyltransferase
MPDLHARLQSDPPARVADIGCGGGWSSIGMALAYPKVRVDGFDLDEASVELAWANARQAGLTDRFTFHVRDVGGDSLNGHYDLVTAFECLHDMGNPVGVLRTMHRLAGDEGSVLVMDERVGDRFTAKGDDVEWMMYGMRLCTAKLTRYRWNNRIDLRYTVDIILDTELREGAEHCRQRCAAVHIASISSPTTVTSRDTCTSTGKTGARNSGSIQ